MSARSGHGWAGRRWTHSDCRPIGAATGDVITFAGTSGAGGSADGSGPAASFQFPSGVATDSAGNVFVADLDNNNVRKITPGAVVTTFAGSGLNIDSDGTGIGAAFKGPVGAGNRCIRQLVRDHRQQDPQDHASGCGHDACQALLFPGRSMGRVRPLPSISH